MTPVHWIFKFTDPKLTNCLRLFPHHDDSHWQVRLPVIYYSSAVRV